jgi:hypothetical protein
MAMAVMEMITVKTVNNSVMAGLLDDVLDVCFTV